MSQGQLSIFRVNSFHDSTQERDEKRLSQQEKIAQLQDAKILEFMKTHVRKQGWTSWEIHNEHFQNMLETSVRRALTNNSYDLFNKNGCVFKTRARREGGHGASVVVWQYRAKYK